MLRIARRNPGLWGWNRFAVVTGMANCEVARGESEVGAYQSEWSVGGNPDGRRRRPPTLKVRWAPSRARKCIRAGKGMTNGDSWVSGRLFCMFLWFGRTVIDITPLADRSLAECGRRREWNIRCTLSVDNL